MSRLVIAEKPSVAQSIAKVIGAAKRQDGYVEGNGYIVSWCVGHLVELAAADQYDPRFSKWSREDLPIVPEPWQFTVSAATKKQFAVLKSLMARPDVESLVCATDAGREGELIFRLVYHKAGCKKPFSRLWISSMEDAAIEKGFANLLNGSNYDSLYEAALCRAKADWLVGINGTRLFTTLYGGKTLNVGRVMTPTLALLTERETAITGFQKQKFYAVELNFGTYRAASERMASKTDAEKLRTACVGKPVTVREVSRQEKTEKPPKLYDLTTLQREANRLYGYTAQQTLDCVQLLYEKKLCTYPRTDSQYLTEDMAAGLPALCETVATVLPFVGGTVPFSVDAAQVINNGKVSDHHAIIPTGQIAAADLAALPTTERNVLTLLSLRLLVAVSTRHSFAETALKLDCGGVDFAVKGRVTLSEGWRALDAAFQSAQKQKDKEKTGVVLPELEQGQLLSPASVEVKEGVTSPPKRFTEDSLLSAMENAGSEDFAAIEDVERKGLGTPATRAGVIEKLVKGGFMERKDKQLIPTAKGMELIRVMPDMIKSAKLTAEWETALKQVERGEASPADFMDGIAALTADLVKTYAGVNVGTGSALSKSGRAVIGACPRCGKNVVEGKKSFFCEGYNDTPPCGFALWKQNKYFESKRKELTKKVAAALLKDGRVRMTGLFSEKKGILYDATIVLDDSGGKYVNFKLEFDQKKGGKS